MHDTGVAWRYHRMAGPDSNNTKFVAGATTILEGLYAIADQYGLTIITDEEQASQADLTILCVGEIPYAEWEGDTPDLSLTGSHALPGNKKAIELAKSLNKPTVTLIVAGRNMIIEDYYDSWDAVVMCYLPGSEADGIANVLTGKVFSLNPAQVPWYKSVNDIGTGNYKFDMAMG